MLFPHLPPDIRDQELSKLKGQKALSYPAAYGLKTSKHWVTITPTNTEGIVIKTIQNMQIFTTFTAWLIANNIEHKVIQL